MPVLLNELLKNKPNLEVVNLDQSVDFALKKMIENDFSQLPVVDYDRTLIGVISEQTISRTYHHLKGSIPLLESKVKDCTVKVTALSENEDLSKALKFLRDEYAVVVVDPNRVPIGILTNYDTTYFFQSLYEGLLWIEDIEVTLRKEYIEKILVTENSMQAALYRAFKRESRDPSKPPKKYNELDFYDHIQLIITDETWPKFEPYFENKKFFHNIMEPVLIARNQLVHFRGKLSTPQKDAINRALQWLQNRPKIVISQGYGLVTTESYGAHTGLTHNGTVGSALDFLAERQKGNNIGVKLNFGTIESITGSPLPSSAKESRSWWSSEKPDWKQADWRVETVDFQEQTVTFRLSSSRLMQLFFADALKNLKETRPGITKVAKVSPQNWISMGAGRTYFTFDWAFGHDTLRTQLYIDTPNKEKNKEIFETLLLQKPEIEASIGEPLTWQRMDDSRACRIYLTKPGNVTKSPEELAPLKKWAVETMLKFFDTFHGRIKG